MYLMFPFWKDIEPCYWCVNHEFYDGVAFASLFLIFSRSIYTVYILFPPPLIPPFTLPRVDLRRRLGGSSRRVECFSCSLVKVKEWPAATPATRPALSILSCSALLVGSSDVTQHRPPLLRLRFCFVLFFFIFVFSRPQWNRSPARSSVSLGSRASQWFKAVTQLVTNSRFFFFKGFFVDWPESLEPSGDTRSADDSGWFFFFFFLRRLASWL